MSVIYYLTWASILRQQMCVMWCICFLVKTHSSVVVCDVCVASIEGVV